MSIFHKENYSPNSKKKKKNKTFLPHNISPLSQPKDKTVPSNFNLKPTIKIVNL